MEEKLNEIGQKAYDSWPGTEGEERRRQVIELIRKKLKAYSAKLGLEEELILEAWEKSRNYSVVNFYQEANFPDLDEVMVLKSLDEFKEKFPSGKSLCPACGGVSTDFYECNSGRLLNGTGKRCNWKVYGLFGDLGKGIYVITKDQFMNHPRPSNIFKPIELVDAVQPEPQTQ